MKARIIERETAPIPFAAIANARMRNTVGATHFTAAQRRKAQAMLYALQTFYHPCETYINWRDGGKCKRPKFAAVKFDQPRVADRKGLSAYEDSWSTDTDLSRFDKIKTAQGITYRFYFV